MRKTWIALLVIFPCVFARGDEKNCQEVSGGVVENFLSPPAVGSSALGTATGDLRGGLGIVILSITNGQKGSTVFHVQHHWVTETGDTIFLDPADVTVSPGGVPGAPGLLAAKYLEGVRITGGTGRFAKAKGNIGGWGAVDTSTGQIVLRYQGTICFEGP